MKKYSKRLRNAHNKLNSASIYNLPDAINVLSEYTKSFAAKFDESVHCYFKLGLDNSKQDNILRGFVDLPHGTGNKKKIAVFVDDPVLAKKALADGAFRAGGDELIQEILNSSVIDFDECIAVSNMMPKLAKLAKILGPAGLMPNPKLGTVCDENALAVTISSLSSKRVMFKAEKDGVIKFIIGKLSFDSSHITDNLREVYSVLKSIKPNNIKGVYFIDTCLSTTCGISIKLKTSTL